MVFRSGLEQKCIDLKAAFFRPLFGSLKINVENAVFLLEQETPFKLTTRYPLNEESAWFGFISWIIILPALLVGVYRSIKNRNMNGIVLIFTSVIYFVLISSFKFGWDPYSGRYLITMVALLMPFTAFIFNQRTRVNRILIAILCTCSIFIASYTLINNDSRPLIGKAQFNRVKWEDFTVTQKFAYKFIGLAVHDKNVWGESAEYIKTYADLSYLEPLEAVDKLTPPDTTLGIVAKEGYFPDYLFFGNSFDRKLIPIKNGLFIPTENYSQIQYLLISPDFRNMEFGDFHSIFNQEGWRLLKRN